MASEYATQAQTLWNVESSSQIYGPPSIMPPTSYGLPIGPFMNLAQSQACLTQQQLPPFTVPELQAWASSDSFSVPSVVPPAKSPRKMLTDDDRKKICQHHEDNPKVKQTEIGAMFGVERSTISKILKEKERYLSGSLSPAKPTRRARGNGPNVEQALENWAWNAQKLGLQLTDSAIEKKARLFAATVGDKSVLKSNWLEEFKRKTVTNGCSLSSPVPSAATMSGEYLEEDSIHKVAPSSISESTVSFLQCKPSNNRPGISINGLQPLTPSTPVVLPPTRNDARNALNTFSIFLRQTPMTFLNYNERMVISNLKEKLR